MNIIISQKPPLALLFILFVILILLWRRSAKKLKLLQYKYSDLENENDFLRKQLEQNDINKKMNIENRMNLKEIESEVANNISKYCHTKTSFITKTESEMLYAMNEILDHILSNKQRKYYHLFPQVNFYAFIEQNDSITEDEKNICQRLIGGKHADFILCHRNYFEYTPILIIELDDLSHFTMKYGKEQFSKTQKNDQLKNNLATDLNLPLLRYRLSYGEIAKADKDILTDALSKFFFDLYNNQQKSIYFYSKNGNLSKEEYYK